MQNVEAEFPIPFPINDWSLLDETRFDIVCTRKRMLDCIRCLEALVGARNNGVQPSSEVKNSALLMIRQANGEMEKEAGFLFLSLLADEQFFPGLDVQLRNKAIEARRSLYERVTNVELRLRDQVARLRDDKTMPMREAVLREAVRDVIKQSESMSAGSVALRNFDGFLVAAVFLQDGTLVPVDEDGMFLVPGNEILRVQAWVSRKQSSEAPAQHEKIIVKDGVDEPSLPVRFEIQGDASHGTLSPATLGVMFKPEEGQSGRVEFRHEGLPAGEHYFWLGCFQGYHYIQGMEMKLRVSQTS